MLCLELLVVLPAAALSQTIDLGGSSRTVTSLSGAGTVINNGANPATLTNQGPSSTFAGVIQDGTSTMALTQNATGNTLTLTGVNSYTGGTTIAAGTLEAGAIGAFSANSAMSVAANATLDLNGTYQTVTSLSGAGTVVSSTAGIATLTNQGPSSTFSGVIQVDLSQNSAGNTLTLSGANAFTNVTVQAGTLKAGAAGALNNFNTNVDNFNPNLNDSILDLGGFAQSISQVSLDHGIIQNGGLATVVGILSSDGAIKNLSGSTSVLSQGTTTLLGTNTYSGATNVAGTLIGGAAQSFSFNSTTNISGVVDLGGFSQAISRVNLYGGTIQNGSLIAGVITSYGGTLGNVSGLTILIATGGLTTLTGANDYLGETDVNGGTLQAGGANAFSQASVMTIATGATVELGGVAQKINTVNLAGGLLFNGDLTGAVVSTGGAIDLLSGSASLTTISGTTRLDIDRESYTGATNVNGGLLIASAYYVFSAASVTTIHAGGAIDLGGFTQAINTLNLAGGTLQNGALTGAATSTGGVINGVGGSMSLTTTAGATTLSGANTYTGPTNINGGTLTASGPNAFSAASVTTINTGGAVDLGGFAQTINSVNLAGGTLQNGQLAGAVTSTGGAINGLGGSASLTVQSGVTTLSGANAYAGPTTVNGGALTGSNANAFSNLSATAVMTNATLDLGGFAQTINQVDVAGGTLQNGALTGTVTSTGGAITSLGGAATLRLASGVTTFGGASSYSGGTTVANAASANVVSNAGLGGGVVTMQAGSTMTLGAGVNVGNKIVAIGGPFFNVVAGNTATISGAIADATPAASSSGVEKTGGGTVTLTGATTSSGATTVSAGSLQLTGGTLVATTAATSVASGTLSVSAAGGLTMKTTQSIASGALASAEPSVAATPISATATVTASGSSATPTLTNTSALALTPAPAISGNVVNNDPSAVPDAATPAPLGVLEKIGGGTLILTGANTYSGGTTINAGALQLAGAGTLGATTGATTVAGGALDIGTTMQTQNGGVTMSSGAILIAAGGGLTTTTLTISGGTLSSAGAISATTSVSNRGTVDAAGSIATPTLTNSGAFSLTDALAINGNVFNDPGTFNIGAKALTVSGDFTNISTSLNAVTIASGGSLTATTINNKAGVFTSAGAIAATTSLTNSATLNVAGVVTTPLLNNSAAFNVSGPVNAASGAIGVFNNSGSVALGAQSLGGVTTFNNTGTLAATTGKLGAATFNNAGVLDLRQANFGTAGAFALNGAFASQAGSVIDINVSSTAQQTNLMNVRGTGNGASKLDLTIDPQRVTLLTSPTTFLTTSGGAIAFATPTINGAAQSPNALLNYVVLKNGANYQLYNQLNGSAVGGVAGGVASAVGAAQAGFFQGATAILNTAPNQNANFVDYGVWTRDAAGVNIEKSAVAASSGGLTVSTPLSTISHFSGEQIGADFAIFNMGGSGWNLHSGLTGGEYDASSSGNGDQTNFRVPFIGGYAAVSGHGFNLNLLVRHDQWYGHVTSPSILLNNAPLNGSGTAVTAELGYQISFANGFFLKPSTAFSFNRARFGTLSQSGNFAAGGLPPYVMSVGPVTSELGVVSLQMGYPFQSGQWALVPNLVLSGWHEFAGSIPGSVASTSTANNTAFNYALATGRVGTFGQIGVGIAGSPLALPNLLTFVRADYRTGSNITGGAFTVGARYSF